MTKTEYKKSLHEKVSEIQRQRKLIRDYPEQTKYRLDEIGNYLDNIVYQLTFSSFLSDYKLDSRYGFQRR